MADPIAAGAAAGLSTFEAAVTLVRDVGFPAFVAGWFMFRLEGKFDKMTTALENLEKKL